MILFENHIRSNVSVNSSRDCVPFVEEVVSLGVILDSTLSWRPQIQEITKKVNRVLYGLRLIRPCTSQILRKRLIESLVVPHLDYCNVVYSDIFYERSVQLQRHSNVGNRYIYGIRWNEHSTPFRQKLHWMSNMTRINYFASLTMYRLVRMKEPPLLLSFFKPFHSDRPTLGPRIALAIPSVSTDWGLHSFQVNYAHLWNLIPPCIRDLPSYSRFKKSIKQFLYNQDIRVKS